MREGKFFLEIMILSHLRNRSDTSKGETLLDSNPKRLFEVGGDEALVSSEKGG